MTVIVVPGYPGTSIEYERRQLFNMHGGGQYWSNYDFIALHTWSHGWPFEYLRRPYIKEGFLIDFDGRPVLWSSPRAWQITGKIYAFSPLGFLQDLIIGAAILAIAVAACEVWRRRRGGFRFSLLDGAALTTMVCLILGWWQYHARAQASEQAIKASMTARGSLTDFSKGGPDRAWATSSYQGPDWLQRLIGNSFLLPFCFHIDKLTLDTTLLTHADYAQLGGLTYVESVHLVGKLNEGLADALAALPALHTLDGQVTAHGGFPNAPKLEPLIAAGDFSLLKPLQNLRVLKLGNSKVEPADLVELACRPNLERLQIDDDDLLIEDLVQVSHISEHSFFM